MLGDEHLPEGVERSRRVFMPKAMFSTMQRSTRGAKFQWSLSHGSSGAIVAGGPHGLRIGLAQHPDLLETSFFDLFDVQHQFWPHFSDKEPSDPWDDTSLVPGVISVVSVGVGALTMVGSQAIGVRGLVKGVLRITNLLGKKMAWKWSVPVLGMFTIRFTVYLVLELLSSILWTVGRWVRTSHETLKVLRLASWDPRGKFRRAMKEQGKEVKVAEEVVK